MNASLLIVAVLFKAAVGVPITWSFAGGNGEGVFSGFFTYDDDMVRTSFTSGLFTYTDGHTKLSSTSTYRGFGSISITGDVIGHLEASSDHASIIIQDDTANPGDAFTLAINGTAFDNSSLFIFYWTFGAGAPSQEMHTFESSELKGLVPAGNESYAGGPFRPGLIGPALRVVPEPATFALLTLGLIGARIAKRKRRIGHFGELVSVGSMEHQSHRQAGVMPLA